ncbi:hypothetical protein [Nocardioides marmorisolisilvae]|uniref:hypothetical protein n=1 Tax=Nocardioides marmorisolisilvae TaxID=1542737 RepID=UPI0011CE3B9E|nr:hypothetical protein [Nocardioides marmorisolisilvae]
MLHRHLRIWVTASVALLLVCLSGPAQAASIDPWPSYDGQTKCSPSAKKGTLKLAAYLQKHYPGSGSYGISRACSSGGRSEHKEGRAFDWRVNVNRAKERGYAMDFIKRVRATDSAGNRDALARRMGIMYIIFNDTIYSSTYNFAARPYLNSACKSRSSCSATLRHRDHMHISLTRAGGAGKTSWYSGHVLSGGSSTPTTPTPTDIGHEDNDIPTLSLARPVTIYTEPGETSSTRLAVKRGQTIKVTAYGVARFGPGHQLVTDPTCVWNDETEKWEKNPRPEVKARYGDPELRVNGVAILASSSCHGGQHVYSAKIVQKRTTPIKVTMGGRDQQDGLIRVVLSRPTANIGSSIPKAPTAARAPLVRSPIAGSVRAVRDDVTLDGRDPGTWSDQALEAGVEYKVTVSGTQRIARGVATDGQCLSIDGRWERQGSMDLYRPGATHGALYIDGVRFKGSAPAEDLTGCMLHSHTMTYRPTESGRVALSVFDPTGNDDNDGSLTVRFDRVTPVALPTAAPAEDVGRSTDWTRTSDAFTVPANDPAGRISSMRLKTGRGATIYVDGTVDVSDDLTTDASCVQNDWRWVTDFGLASGQDLFGLAVDGQDVDWLTSRNRQSGCDYRHKYVLHYTATKNGPLRIALADLDYGDNSGSFNVSIVRD